MNLRAIRDQFIRASGRADLATVKGADNGANWFINAGQQMLESMALLPQMFRNFPIILQAGSFYVPVPGLISAENVMFCEAGQYGVTRLTKANLSELQDEYPDLQVQNTLLRPVVSGQATVLTGCGTPLYYTTVMGITSPARNLIKQALADNATLGNDASLVSTDYGQKTVRIFPGSLTGGTLMIEGYFNSPVLNEDGEGTFWTALYPNILVHAALYQLEVFYRNTEGAQDWMRAIQLALMNLDQTAVQDEQVNINQMEG